MMRGKKRLVADVLRHSRALVAAARLRRRQLRRQLIVFNYHRVRPDGDFSTDLEEWVYDTDASTFAAQMRWLKANTDVLTEDELIRHLDDPRPLRRPASLITFDDGYLDNYTIAYPILRDLELPAMLFVPTQIIGERQLGWWDQMSYVIKRSTRPFIDVEGQTFELPTQRRAAASYYQEYMKKAPQQRTADLVQRLSEACEVEPPGAERADLELMTWYQIREVASHNFTIGCHTHTHRVLSTLPTSEQEGELVRSREILEDELGEPVRSIAYPVGEQQFLSPETARIARRLGYAAGFTYLTGVNSWGSMDNLAISRVAATEDLSSFIALAILPEVFTLL